MLVLLTNSDQANAGNVSHRLPFLRMLIRRLRCVVLATSYRGYGPNPGNPTEAGLKMDSEAAIDYVLHREDLNSDLLVLLGRSLGGAITIHLAVHHQDVIKAVMVENTFTCVEDMVPQVLPFLGYFIGRGKLGNFLVRNKWRNEIEIKKLRNMPILLLSSTEDEIVPHWQMQKLKQDVVSPNCMFVELLDAHHMDGCEVCPIIYWSAMEDFFKKYVTDCNRANM